MKDMRIAILFLLVTISLGLYQFYISSRTATIMERIEYIDYRLDMLREIDDYQTQAIKSHTDLLRLKGEEL